DPTKRAGKLGGMSKSNALDYVLEAEEILNLNNAPPGNNIMLVHPTANSFLKANDLVAAADRRGMNPAIQTGVVGQVYNTTIAMSQCVNYAASVFADTQDGAVNNSPNGYAAGEAGALTVTDPGNNWQVGEFAVIAGNDQPTYITATCGTSSITLNEPLKYAVAHSAVIKHY